MCLVCNCLYVCMRENVLYACVYVCTIMCMRVCNRSIPCRAGFLYNTIRAMFRVIVRCRLICLGNAYMVMLGK